jgi:hypothetical protein
LKSKLNPIQVDNAFTQLMNEISMITREINSKASSSSSSLLSINSSNASHKNRKFRPNTISSSAGSSSSSSNEAYDPGHVNASQRFDSDFKPSILNQLLINESPRGFSTTSGAESLSRSDECNDDDDEGDDDDDDQEENNDLEFDNYYCNSLDRSDARKEMLNYVI